MGELVDAAITQATTGLAERDVSLCARVIADDALVNDRQRELRELSFSLIVNQSPTRVIYARSSACSTCPPNWSGWVTTA